MCRPPTPSGVGRVRRKKKPSISIQIKISDFFLVLVIFQVAEFKLTANYFMVRSWWIIKFNSEEDVRIFLFSCSSAISGFVMEIIWFVYVFKNHTSNYNISVTTSVFVNQGKIVNNFSHQYGDGASGHE